MASQLLWLLGEYFHTAPAAFPIPEWGQATPAEHSSQGEASREADVAFFHLIPGLGLEVGELFAPKACFPLISASLGSAWYELPG